MEKGRAFQAPQPSVRLCAHRRAEEPRTSTRWQECVLPPPTPAPGAALTAQPPGQATLPGEMERDQAITQARRTSLGCGRSWSSICSAESSDLHTLQNGYCQVEGKATRVGPSPSRLCSTHTARPHPCGLLPLLRTTLSGPLF